MHNQISWLLYNDKLWFALIVIENSSVYFEEKQAFVVCVRGDMHAINYVANVLMHQVFVLEKLQGRFSRKRTNFMRTIMRIADKRETVKQFKTNKETNGYGLSYAQKINDKS